MIKSHNNNNTKGHRALARRRWLTCKQSGKVSLDDYISSYSKSYNDLLQTGVPHDAEAELSQFLAGLDTKRHNIEGLAALELQDLTSFGIPSPYRG